MKDHSSDSKGPSSVWASLLSVVFDVTVRIVLRSVLQSKYSYIVLEVKRGVPHRYLYGMIYVATYRKDGHGRRFW